MLAKLGRQAGWVSLPIVLLLLAMASASAYFQRQFLASYEWRLLFQQSQQTGRFAQAFWQEFVNTPNFAQASPSQCEGFCTLAKGLSSQRQWQTNTQTYFYQWHSYQEEMSSTVFYRLCVSKNQSQYYCWWWQNSHLQSHGWLPR
ncbi:hypothetical protein [Marinomonas epiphytica]